MIIDAHVHVSDLWYEPVEILKTQMRLNGVAAAVLVQLGGQFDNAYQEKCLRESPDMFASVVAVDQEDPDAIQHLRQAHARGAAGLRLKTGSRRPHGDPLALWKEAEQLGLVISCIARSHEILSPVFQELLHAVPNLTIALEHLGESRRANPTLTEVLATTLYETISPWPNVYVKVHGPGEASPRTRPLQDPPFAHTPPAPLAAYRILGAQRMMWGSDFPPVSGREGYRNALTYTRILLREYGVTDSEEAAIFGGVAARLFGLHHYGGLVEPAGLERLAGKSAKSIDSQDFQRKN